MLAAVLNAARAWTPQDLIGLLGLLALSVFGVYGFIKWLFSGPAKPDPWGAQLAESLEQPDVKPLCHRCLMPNDPQADYCSECGATIGQYTNYLPFPYIFSLGHTLRLGTAGEFKRTPLTVAGFFLLSAAEYMVLAPVYWIILLLHLPRKRAAETTLS